MDDRPNDRRPLRAIAACALTTRIRRAAALGCALLAIGTAAHAELRLPRATSMLTPLAPLTTASLVPAEPGTAGGSGLVLRDLAGSMPNPTLVALSELPVDAPAPVAPAPASAAPTTAPTAAAAPSTEAVLLDAASLSTAAWTGDSSLRERAVAVAPIIDAAAREHALDPLLLHAIAFVESRYRPEARSSAGAVGLMQVMPATGRRFGVDQRAALKEPATSVDVGANYLKWLHGRFDNNLVLVVAAYNAGEGAVERYGNKVPPYTQTRRYVQRVLEQYLHLRETAAALDTARRAIALAP